jgi:hypothetical protein
MSPPVQILAAVFVLLAKYCMHDEYTPVACVSGQQLDYPASSESQV